MNEEKIDELLRLMRSVIPDTSDMNDAGRVGFVYKGDYDEETPYEELDVVLYGMSLWVPKTDTIGNPPPDQSQEEVKENEFWKLFLPGTLSSDYVKKTDYAQVGFAGIVQPDGKTIKVGENGLITGASAGFVGTKEEYEIAIAEGNIEPGMTVFITDDFSAPTGSNIRIGTKKEIEAALEAGEIEDGTLLFITDDFIESGGVADKEELGEIKAAISTAQETADEAKQEIEDLKEFNTFTLDIVGWKEILNVPCDYGMSFTMYVSEKQGASNSTQIVNISTTEKKVLITQLSDLSSIGGYRISIIDGIIEDGVLKIYGFSNGNINKVFVKIVGTNENVEWINESIPSYQPSENALRMLTNNGIIADRALNDGDGNSITENYFTKTEGEELKKSVSDGKSLVAAAITAKGVTTAADAEFATIATNVEKITTGVDTSDATATAGDALSGKTFYAAGAKITGTMSNNGAVSPAALSAGGSYTIPAGYHNGSGKVTAAALSGQTSATAVAEDISFGKTAWVNGSKLTGTHVDKVNTTTLIGTITAASPNLSSDLNVYFPASSGSNEKVCFVETKIDYYNASGAKIVSCYDVFYLWCISSFFNGGGTRLDASNTVKANSMLQAPPSNLTTSSYGGLIRPCGGSAVMANVASMYPQAAKLATFTSNPVGSTDASVTAVKGEVTTTITVATILP